MPFRARVFVFLTVVVGATLFTMACAHWHSSNPLKFACYLLIALLASTMKLTLPRIDGTMSVIFLFIFLGVLELSLAETLVIGCASVLLQCLWKTRHRPEAVKVAFNVFGLTSNSICLTSVTYQAFTGTLKSSTPIPLLAAACTFYFCNILALSLVIALTERRPLRAIWSETCFWTLPYNLAGAVLVGAIGFANHYVSWELSLLIVLVMYVLYRFLYLYLDRLEEQTRRVQIEEMQVIAEKRHVEQIGALHLRTIEGLALAIDAKDHTTHRHLHRVRVYATEIAREMGLNQDDSDALSAAALLHDIGKLAVPDHIVNKPGRLTAEEFEKMKIHPIVGEQILDRISFPYPVASMVRAHHERWDGSGYPDGLKGEEIPIGARILGAVDCLDALASDRQYRKALPLKEAMRAVVAESGISFDPVIVEILERRHLELEALVVESQKASKTETFDLNFKVQRGKQPGVGLAVDPKRGRMHPSDFLSSIADARHEAQTLFELSQELGNSLSLEGTLSLVALRLRKLVQYDSIAVFINQGLFLVPAFASGENSSDLSSLAIPIGSGLCGWVAQNQTPILNGNPAVETGYADISNAETCLRSALAVPLEGFNGPVGVLALYRAELDSFTSDDLRILQVITSKVAHFIENALKYRLAEDSATRDYLTGLPNSRALALHLKQELARCKRELAVVAVMGCDLNGFKEVNDRYGHQAGDQVLKAFSSLVRTAFRGYDYAARVGGDEFVIVAPNMTPASVQEKAALLSALAQQAGRDVCSTESLSLSVGTAFYPEDGTDTEELLAEADRRMFTSKQRHYEQNRGSSDFLV